MDQVEGSIQSVSGASLGVSSISVQKPTIPQSIRVVEPKIFIFPDGFKLDQGGPLTGEQPEHLKDVIRGRINGFSTKSAARLRQHCMELFRAGCDPYAFTLTTRAMHDAKGWEIIMKRFRRYLKETIPNVPGIWRIELQRRGTPHLHCTFWFEKCIPLEAAWNVIESLWLKATKEDKDRWAKKKAVMGKDISCGSGWAVYQALHDGKHKESQLGWKGRQWGFFTKESFQRRTPLAEGEMPIEVQIPFLRRLRQLTRRRFMKRTGRLAKPQRCLWAGRGIPAQMMQSHSTLQLLRGLIEEVDCVFPIPPDYSEWSQKAFKSESECSQKAV